MYLLIFWIVISILRISDAGEICCEDIGCFSNTGSFSHLPTPDCVGDHDIYFRYFNRENKKSPETFRYQNLPKDFNPNLETVVISHGWLGDTNAWWVFDETEALLEHKEMNIIAMDWRTNADNFYYPKAAANTRTAGAYLAKVIDHLVEQNNVTYQSVWCIGFSLGTHVCGHAGMRTKQKIARVTAIDPAGPYFGNYDLIAGVNPTSAEFVDVIHSDGDGIFYAAGSLTRRGHMDFYPNGGRNQPGCFTYDKNRKNCIYSKLCNDPDDPKRKDDDWWLTMMGCSHHRSLKFFIESIKTPECFVSHQICTNVRKFPSSCEECMNGTSPCAIMGYHAQKSNLKSGIFYLKTNPSKPYCIPFGPSL